MERESRGAIAVWLRVRRRESGQTQTEARAEYARRSGREVSSGTWSRWENGAQTVGEEALPALEEMYGPAPRPPMPLDLEQQVAAAVALGIEQGLRPLGAELVRAILEALAEERAALRLDLERWLNERQQ